MGGNFKVGVDLEPHHNLKISVFLGVRSLEVTVMKEAEAKPGAVTSEKVEEVTTFTRLTTVTTTEMTTAAEVIGGSGIREKEGDSTSHEAVEEEKVKDEREEEGEEVKGEVGEKMEEVEEDEKDGGEEDASQEGQHLLKKLMSPWESEVRKSNTLCWSSAKVKGLCEGQPCPCVPGLV